jgi:hypothetical protein
MKKILLTCSLFISSFISFAQIYVTGGMNLRMPNFYNIGAGYSFYAAKDGDKVMLPSFQFETTFNHQTIHYKRNPTAREQTLVNSFLRFSPSINIGAIQKKDFSYYLTIGGDYALSVSDYDNNTGFARAELCLGYDQFLLRGSALLPVFNGNSFDNNLKNISINAGLVVFFFVLKKHTTE